MKFPKKVEIFEVGPRDGLQSEKKVWSIEQRVSLVKLLLAAGIVDIEIGSFVRRDLLPQVANTEKIIHALKSDQKKYSAKFWAFVPNKVGLEHAVQAKVNGVSFFVGVSDTFCKKNVNQSRESLLKALTPLLKNARAEKLSTRVYLSTIVFCPYEGVMSPKETALICDRIFDSGTKELVLSDTTGSANPKSLMKLLDIVLKKHSAKNIALHLHDTRGLALSNALIGMSYGISRIDSSIAGMGGCPYAPGASGNLATEDLANMLLGMGHLQGVNLGLLAKAGLYAEKICERKLPSKVLRSLDKAGV